MSLEVESIDYLMPEIAAAQKGVKRTRDVMAGEETVKAGGTTYLPKRRYQQSDDEYQRLLMDTEWYPAARRTAQGKHGLMFARNVVLNAPRLEPIAQTITNEAEDWRSWMESTVWDALQSNWTMLLVDHATEGSDDPTLNGANALERGIRPFIYNYTLDDLRSIRWGNWRNRRHLMRVVLIESSDRRLELALNSGVYQSRVHTMMDGQWIAAEWKTPSRNGEALNEIPLVIVSDNKAALPQASVLTDISALNLHHYTACSRQAMLLMYGGGVVPVISGVTLERDPKTGKVQEPKIHVGADASIVLEKAEAKAYFLEPEGHLSEALRLDKLDIEEHMAKCGARLLAPERVAPEAAETVAMRSAAEDSTNASLALKYARRMSQALGWVNWWMGGEREEAFCTLNTDYRNSHMTAQERQVAAMEVQSGLRSWEDWFYERRDRGVVNSTLTPEEERDRIEADAIDRPVVREEADNSDTD